MSLRLRKAVPALTALLGAALAAGALLAPTARAGFGPIQLQSVGPLEQFEEASEPAISGNGQYLAFRGRLAGGSGVWLKALATGQLQVIAPGAEAPSISADGQYVSFTTSEPLVGQAHAGSNVYVRDMAIEPAYLGPCSASQEAAGRCPYELASALNGSEEGLTYYGGGALASARVSLSADGRAIAFMIAGPSNLTSVPGGSTPGTATPEGQVAVRYLDRHETLLVSAEREAGSGAMSARPVVGGAYTQIGAALSGDGTTVAWLGAHIPAQAPTLSGEGRQIEHDDDQPREDGEAYDEPLWRRIADGPAAPTRRMVGGGDPLAPGCPPGGTIAIPACQGPYPKLAWDNTRGEQAEHRGWLGIPGYNGIPQLSYDGWTAALIGDPDSTADVFVVNMHEGLDRVQALRELTPEVPVSQMTDPGSQPQYLPTAGDVYEVAISPDGRRIAFTTQRQLFPLAPLDYIEEPPSQLGVVELYEIFDETLLERVTHGPRNGASLEGANPVLVTSKGASAPSFSEDDRTLAFADTASNLVYGDVNDAGDVFTATADETAGAAGQTTIAPPPPGEEPLPQWRLSVAAVTHGDGSVTLDVVVPGAGLLSATAGAAVPLGASALARVARAHRPAARRGRLRPAPVAVRTVATAQVSAAVPGVLELPLRVFPRYAGLLATAAGLYASVQVTFTGPGGPRLTQTLALALHRKPRASSSARGRKTKARHGRGRRVGRTGGKARGR